MPVASALSESFSSSLLELPPMAFFIAWKMPAIIRQGHSAVPLSANQNKAGNVLEVLKTASYFFIFKKFFILNF